MTSAEKVIFRHIDGYVGAELAQSAAFYFTARGGDDFGAEMLGDLDRRDADAAAAALNEQPIAGFQIAVSLADRTMQ